MCVWSLRNSLGKGYGVRKRMFTTRAGRGFLGVYVYNNGEDCPNF